MCLQRVFNGGFSAGVRWRFLKGAVGRTVEDGGVGGQHVAPWFLGAALRLLLGPALGGLLVLVLVLVVLGQAGAGGRASIRHELGGSRGLVAAVVLEEERGDTSRIISDWIYRWEPPREINKDSIYLTFLCV